MSRLAAAPSLLLLTAVTASLPVLAQKQAPVDAAVYYTLIKDYRQGRAEAAIDALVALVPSATDGIVTGSDPHWTPEEMTAAALLETEAGFRSNSLSALSARLSNADLWLVRARRALVKEKLDTSQQDEIRRRWSLTVGRKALWLTIVGLADSTLKEACDMFPNDAALHLTYGLARESAAFSVDRVEMIRAAPIGLESALSSPSSLRTDALVQARQALERAVELDPALAEARVRLARVYVLLKDEKRAIPHLEHARTLESLPAYRYLASLMLGDLRRRAGDVDLAIELYLSARHLLPNAQSSYVAQAHALRAAGRPEDATAVIEDMLGRPAHDDDPWVYYPRGFEFALTQFAPLRALVQEK